MRFHYVKDTVIRRIEVHLSKRSTCDTSRRQRRADNPPEEAAPSFHAIHHQ